MPVVPQDNPRLKRWKQAQGALQAASTVKPDEHGLALREADRLGVPVPQARAAVSGAPEAARLADTGRDAILSKNPRLARWMGNADNAAIGQDDAPALDKIERGASGPSIWGSLPDAASAGMADLAAHFYHLGVARGLVSPETAAAAVSKYKTRAAEFRASKPPEAVEFSEDVEAAGPGEGRPGIAGPPVVKDDFGLFFRPSRSPLPEHLRRLSGIEQATSFAETAVDVGAAAAENPEGLLYATVENVPNAIPSLITGLAGGLAAGPIGFGAGVFGGSYMTEYGAWIDQELAGIDQTDPAALLAKYRDTAFMQAASERANRKGLATAGVDALFGALAGRGLVKAKGVGGAVKAGAKEVGEQMAGESAGEAAGQLAATGKLDVADVLLEGLVAGPQSAAEVASGAAVRALPARVAKETLETTVRAVQAQQDAAGVQQAAEGLGESAAAKRYAPAVRALMDEAATAGGTVAPSVPVEAWDAHWTAEGKSPAVEARRVTGSPTAYAEAKVTGALPLSFAQVVEHAADVLPDVRFRPDGPTVTEADAWLTDLPKMMQEAVDAVESVETPPVEDEARAAEIEERLGVPEGASVLWQEATPNEASEPNKEDTTDPLRLAADAIEAVPAPGLVGRVVGAVTGAQPVADAVRSALSPKASAEGAVGEGQEPSHLPLADALATAAQRDPAGTAAALRELADINDRRAKSPAVMARKKIEAAIVAAGRPAMEAKQVARIIAAFTETMKARFPSVDWDKFAMRFVRSAAPEGALEQGGRNVFAWYANGKLHELGDAPTHAKFAKANPDILGIQPEHEVDAVTDTDAAFRAGAIRLGAERGSLYINMMPTGIDGQLSARDIARMQDAARAVAEAGARGVEVVYVDTGDESITVPLDGLLRAKTGAALLKLGASTQYQRPEGGSARGAYDRLTRTVHLFETADPSTLIHEVGHWMVDLLGTIPEAAEMYDALVTEAGGTVGTPLTRDQHEKLARSFEAYVMTGDAPSAGLRRAFALMADALRRVYRAVRELIGADAINPELRAVFDRMLATDEELAASVMPALFPDAAALKAAGIDPALADSATYLRVITEAGDRKREALTREAMAALRKEKEDERDALLRDYRADLAARVETLPAVVALDRLRTGDVKLDAQGVKDAGLRIGKLGVTAETGISPDSAAEMFGFASADALADGLLLANSRDRLVDALARERLRKDRPDLVMDREAIRAEAKKIVADEDVIAAEIKLLKALLGPASKAVGKARGETAKAENKGLQSEIEAGAAKASGEREAQAARTEAFVEGREAGRTEGAAPVRGLVRRAERAEAAGRAGDAAVSIAEDLRRAAFANVPTLQETRDIARRVLATKGLDKIRPGVYLMAVQREGRTAAIAAHDGKFDVAARAKAAQAINLALYREAVRITGQAARDVRAMKKTQLDSRQRTMGLARRGFRNQANKLLARFGLSELTPEEAAETKPLAEWLAELRQAAREDLGSTIVPMIPDWLLDESIAPGDWKHLTADQLHDLRNTVQQLYVIARDYHKALAQGRYEDLDTAALEFAANITASREKLNRGFQVRPTVRQRLTAEGSLMDRYVYEMDGGPGGVGFHLLLRKRNEGEAEIDQRSAVVKKATRAAMKELTAAERARWSKPRTIPGVSKPVSHENILCMALLEGTETGRQRNRFAFTQDEIAAMLATLTKRDEAWLNQHWALPESMWGESRDMMERVWGLASTKLAAVPFEVVTAEGETLKLTGGYAKIKYSDDKAYQQDEADVLAEIKGGAALSAQARFGARHERLANVDRIPRYDYGVVLEGLGETITALALIERVRDINFVLNHAAVAKAIKEHYGEEVYDQFKAAMKALVVSKITSHTASERVGHWLRAGTVISLIGVKAVTNLLNLQGIMNSVDTLGPDVMTEQARLMNPISFVKAVKEMWAESPDMANRAATFDRDQANIRRTLNNAVHIKKLNLTLAIPDAVHSVPMMPLAFTQLINDLPTYRVAKRRALVNGKDEKTAIAEAVQEVKDTQGSGLPADIPTIMRNHANWTMFMGFMNRTANLAIRRGRMGGVSAKGFARTGATIFLLYVSGGIAQTLIRALRGDEDLEDTDAFWLSTLYESALSMFGGHPLAREAASAVRYGSGYSGPADAAFFDKLGVAKDELFDKTLDERDAEVLMSVAGILFHLPSQQAIETWRGTRAYLEGDAGPQAVLLGAPREKYR